MTIPVIIGLVVALVGSSGIVWRALSWNREQSGELLDQHRGVFADMKSLNEELQGAVDRIRNERDDLAKEVLLLRAEVARLRKALEKLGVEIP